MNADKTKQPLSVLMVCIGNICRSPLAAAALRQVAEREGLALRVDSAGTGDWHVGNPPDQRAQDVARRMGGVDISDLRARQISPDDFYAFDHMAMDHDNLLELQTLRPKDATATVELLLDHVPGQQGKAVADPYYGEAAGFEMAWVQVSAAAAAFVKSLR